jgi:hypothetical protein
MRVLTNEHSHEVIAVIAVIVSHCQSVCVIVSLSVSLSVIVSLSVSLSVIVSHEEDKGDQGLLGDSNSKSC